MCSCGGELTLWCFEHGDWVCGECGCYECEADDFEDAEAEWHDRQHPVWNEGCDDCVARAEQIEADRAAVAAARTRRTSQDAEPRDGGRP
jgi:hypothetical protein